MPGKVFKCRRQDSPPTKTNIFATYVNEVRANLHVVLAFSPSSEQFRARLRMFPSLVNCCTIDWSPRRTACGRRFHPWYGLVSQRRIQAAPEASGSV